MARRYGSPVPSIRNLELHQLYNNEVRCVEKIAIVNDAMIAKTKDGKLYTNDRGIRNAHMINEGGPFFKSTLECLVKLGVISKGDMNTHLEYVEKNEMKEDREYDRKSLDKILNRYGIILSKSQRRNIEEV